MQETTYPAHEEFCSYLCSKLRDESECWEAPRLRELDSKGNLWPGWNAKGEFIGDDKKPETFKPIIDTSKGPLTKNQR